MMGDHEGHQGHDRFRELSALAGSGAITPGEWSELKSHLRGCEECREARLQYGVLSQEGISTLAASYAEGLETESWDDASTRRKLFARVRADANGASFELERHSPSAPKPLRWRRIAASSWTQAAVAACLIVSVAGG